MAWCRRSKVGDAVSRYLTSPKTLITNPPAINNQSSKFTNYPTSRVPKSSSFSPVVANKSSNFKFLGSSYRDYYVDSIQGKHFKPLGLKSWFENPKKVLIVVLVGSGIGVTLYFGNIETIPYTKRKHLILLPKKLERMIGESEFQSMKDGIKWEILPALHPESIRVRMISKDIIDALQRWLKKDEVDESINNESEKGVKSDTGHLEGLKWEFLVVNAPHVVNAFCLPGGKIVVFTGLLQHLRTNDEIATVIGHEVAHVVARHSAEKMTKNLGYIAGHLILNRFLVSDDVDTMSSLLLKIPFSRRMEIEADNIGLLLMASAGYDPRVAPKVYQKMGQINGQNYLSTHDPSVQRHEK